MQKESRLMVLLAGLLLVFLIAVYLITTLIPADTSEQSEIPFDESQEMMTPLSDETPASLNDVDTILTGSITALEGNTITVSEGQKTIITPGPTPDLDTPIVTDYSITATLTEDTFYEGINREQLTLGMMVFIGAKKVSESDEISGEPVIYEANVIQVIQEDGQVAMPEADEIMEEDAQDMMEEEEGVVLNREE